MYSINISEPHGEYKIKPILAGLFDGEVGVYRKTIFCFYVRVYSGSPRLYSVIDKMSKRTMDMWLKDCYSQYISWAISWGKIKDE